MADSWNKKEREKKKLQEKKDKAERKKERREQANSGKGLDAMMAYVDENGVITSTPPDPGKKKEIKLGDIEIGVPKYVPSAEDAIRTGRVTFFNHEKGFGFIRDQASGESIFVHANNLSAPVNENDKVSFEIGHGPKGPMAINVKPLS
ncbi:MAG: cold shock domain-containing protein [Bacteroidetes bacterium]|nr:cold shock domain-containing protein [Bacteroidota bacterium]